MRVKSSLKIMSLLFLMWVGGVCRKKMLLREESIGRESFLLWEEDDRCTMTRFSFLVANHFYCWRMKIGVAGITIGVPGLGSFQFYRWCTGIPGLSSVLKSVMNHIDIAGGERLVYRDSNLSYIIFLLREAKDWCTGTQLYHESSFFLLLKANDWFTGTQLFLDVRFLVLARVVIKIMVKNTLVKTHKRSQV